LIILKKSNFSKIE